MEKVDFLYCSELKNPIGFNTMTTDRLSYLRANWPKGKRIKVPKQLVVPELTLGQK